MWNVRGVRGTGVAAVTTRTQRRIAYTLAWLLLGAVQAMSEAWKPQTEPVPAVRQVMMIADHEGL